MARKKPHKPGKATAAKRKRQAKAAARASTWGDDWPIACSRPMPDDPELLARIAPLTPSQVHDRGLTRSPAQTIVELLENDDLGLSDTEGVIEMVAKWPFRIAKSGSPAPEQWTCLALLAWEQALDLTTVAYSTVELERKNLLAWHAPTHAYVMSPESAEVDSSPDGIAAMDALWERIENESPGQRAQRLWSTPEVTLRTT